MDETMLIMPNTAEYNRDYYAHNKARVLRQRQQLKAAQRASPEVVARGPWLRGLLHKHHLTRPELATLLGMSPKTIHGWLLTPTAQWWLPIPDERVPQITALLPDDRPIPQRTMTRLRWSPARAATYYAQWLPEVPQVTREELLAWRTAQHLSQEAVAQQLHVSRTLIMRWENDYQAIPQKHQTTLWWLMQQEEKES